METPAKKLREFASASAVKSSSLLRSMTTTSRTPARRRKVAIDGMSPTAMEMVPMAKASLLEYSMENPYLQPGMFNLSPPAIFKPRSSYSPDVDNNVRRSPRLRTMMQSKIKSSPNVRRCICAKVT